VLRNVSAVKLLCTGTAPDHTRFHHDYATSVANLRGIMEDMRTAESPAVGVMTVPDDYVKVRHSLFAVS
jgi:hypothetical protein